MIKQDLEPSDTATELPSPASMEILNAAICSTPPSGVATEQLGPAYNVILNISTPPSGMATEQLDPAYNVILNAVIYSNPDMIPVFNTDWHGRVSDWIWDDMSFVRGVY